jgi:hypothetical protein
VTGDERRCVITGEHAGRNHHVSGRGADGAQLDDELSVPLTHDAHELVHEDLRNARLDKPLQANSIPERVERRLRRFGLFLARVAEGIPSLGWMQVVAASVTRWADELRGWIDRLDATFPQWRLA